MSKANIGDRITVRVLKYDGTEYRRWSAGLTGREGSLLILDAEFEDEVQHESLGNIPQGTQTIEYYWLDHWYNIFRFLKNDGTTRLYYCNVSLPPIFEGAELQYTDLDIDILVQPDLSYQVLDVEEFEANSARYGYSGEIQRNARAAVDELTSMIGTRQFPFGENTLKSSVSSGVN